MWHAVSVSKKAGGLSPGWQEVSPDVERLIGQLEQAEDTVSGGAARMAVPRYDAILVEHLRGEGKPAPLLTQGTQCWTPWQRLYCSNAFVPSTSNICERWKRCCSRVSARKCCSLRPKVYQKATAYPCVFWLSENSLWALGWWWRHEVVWSGSAWQRVWVALSVALSCSTHIQNMLSTVPQRPSDAEGRSPRRRWSLEQE